MSHSNSWQACLTRSHIYDADLIVHLENPSHLQRVHDHDLGRDVVRLNSVCWLQIQDTFRDVGPGRYELALRMRLTDRFSWPQGSAVSVEARLTEEDDKVLASQQLDSHFWSSVRQGSSAAATRYHGPGGWFWLVLDPFCLDRKKSSVLFEFKGSEGNEWKSGMEWDFVQLMKLD